MPDKFELVRAYLAAYAARDLAAIAPLLADAVTLRDWKIRVAGKAAALAETRANFEAVSRLEIEVLALYAREQGIAAELRIDVDGRDTIYVVDLFDIDAHGRIAAIRAFIGRGDDDTASA
ncbi:nuclear transport factor 2 family protein [Roseateles saccharophilus]|uniref:SnoaL-like protein n=1 Tax=Roseateles saccharophilus TaxID=304 RepID=A0A4R3VES3_ROSSA|nr:nuclear transport factor 2 family protein [Roseateles saccharophilus]MDG0831717.1 nuclear transport factor 2 family protein [Roseateles saccharophilus]TCV01265.1 SnoaL-like protein [Roseateles saccharophilus]